MALFQASASPQEFPYFIACDWTLQLCCWHFESLDLDLWTCCDLGGIYLGNLNVPKEPLCVNSSLEFFRSTWFRDCLLSLNVQVLHWSSENANSSLQIKLNSPPEVNCLLGFCLEDLFGASQSQCSTPWNIWTLHGQFICLKFQVCFVSHGDNAALVFLTSHLIHGTHIHSLIFLAYRPPVCLHNDFEYRIKPFSFHGHLKPYVKLAHDSLCDGLVFMYPLDFRKVFAYSWPLRMNDRILQRKWNIQVSFFFLRP